MRLVYLAGSLVDEENTKEATLLVWQAGFVPITLRFLRPPDLFSKELLRIACEELISRSEFVVMLPDWEKNEFSQWEYRRAKEIGITTFLRIRELFRLEVA